MHLSYTGTEKLFCDMDPQKKNNFAKCSEKKSGQERKPCLGRSAYLPHRMASPSMLWQHAAKCEVPKQRLQLAWKEEKKKREKTE